MQTKSTIFVLLQSLLWAVIYCHPKPCPSQFEVRLLSNFTPPKTLEAYEITSSRRALLKLKDRLGVSGLLHALRPDIEHADSTWKEILLNSSGHTIASEAHLEATILDSQSFLAWFGADNGDPHKMTGAHPEHYIEEMSVSNGTTTVSIVEAWGDVVTRYKIPSYGNNPKKPWMRELPDFPFQAVGDAVLEDGTTIGNIHNSFRDKPDGNGIELILCVWLPSATPKSIVDGLRQHQAVEFANWLTQAYRDLSNPKSGGGTDY
jgi:hypothetical protein